MSQIFHVVPMEPPISPKICWSATPPTNEITETENKDVTFEWTCMPMFVHGCSGCVFVNHNHLICSVQLNIFRLRIPRPPMSVGRHTCCQPTKQWPPLTSLCSFHKNALMILLIALCTYLGHCIAMKWWIGTAVRTTHIRATRLAGCMRAAFHPGR
jgi:hypothetical protein